MGLFQSFYTHWLLNSGHKASLLSLPFTSFTAVSICALPATSPPPDSIQNQGEASVPQSQSFQDTGNQLYPCPQPARQLGTCAKRHHHTNWHQGRKRSTKLPSSASLCPADLDPSSLSAVSLQVVPFPPETKKLVCRSWQSFQQPRLRKYYRCKIAAWQTFSIHK